LVYGNPEEDAGIINAPVGRHPTERKKMSTRSRWGKESLTYWHVGERYGEITLLDVELKTGRTHQIRVHLSAAGYPVVGDSVYGSSQQINAVHHSLLRSKLKAMHRQALHASELVFCHPVSQETLSFTSPLPDDIAGLCDFLRQLSKNDFQSVD
jgi:23S rRNA pseudouridine1911/1915/1917 synthase